MTWSALWDGCYLPIRHRANRLRLLSARCNWLSYTPTHQRYRPLPRQIHHLRRPRLPQSSSKSSPPILPLSRRPQLPNHP